MALTDCPECSGRVSDRAVACPHCGFPLQEPAAPQRLARPAPGPHEYRGLGRYGNETEWRSMAVRISAQGAAAVVDEAGSVLPTAPLDDWGVTQSAEGYLIVTRRRSNAQPIHFRPADRAAFLASGLAPTPPAARPTAVGGGRRYLNFGLTGTVAGFVWASAAVFALATIVYGIFLGASSGNESAAALFDLAMVADGLLGFAFLAYAVGAVLFVVWFFQAYKSAESLGARRRQWGAGWAIGGWFIPFANFVIPKLVMNEIDRMSHPDAGSPPIDERWRTASRLLISDLWWTSFVAAIVLSNVGTFMQAGELVTASAYASGTGVLAVGTALYAVAGGLLGGVVMTIGGRLKQPAAAHPRTGSLGP